MPTLTLVRLPMTAPVPKMTVYKSMPSQAIQRLVPLKMPWLQGLVHVERTERAVTQKRSKYYGVRTTYLRTVCSATLDQDIAEAPSPEQLSSSKGLPRGMGSRRAAGCRGS